MSAQVRQRRWRLAVRLTAAALTWSVGLALAALLIDAYRGQTASASGGALTLTSRTLVQVHGLGALALVLAPVAASLVVGALLWQMHVDGPAWAERAAWLVIAALAVVAVLGILSVGAAMAPVAVALVAAVALMRRRPAAAAAVDPPGAAASPEP
jgi:hypothetical protein